MDARLEKIEKSEAYFEVEVDPETLEGGLEKAYRKVVKQVNVPGFRKGKVPRDLLEAHFGKEVLYEDALEFIVPDAYENALNNLDINAIAQPEFDIGEINPGQNLIIKVKVAVKPEVKLGTLEGLEINIPAVEVTEADVDKRLEDMQAHYAKLAEKTDSPSELGDSVNIDFVGSIEGVPFEGGTGEDYQLELGSNTFIPGFEEQLVGLKVGDKTDVKVTFPETYHAEELAGKDAIFETTVNKVEYKELRELNDDFAQEVSSFDTLEELRNDIRGNLIKANEYQQKEFKKKEVLSRALEMCEIELAPAAIDVQFQNMLNQFEQRLQSQGIGLEQYFQITQSNLNKFREELLPEAERNAKTNFMLEKIVEEKGFELTDEEVDKQIEEIAQQMGVDFDQAKQNLEGVMDKVRFNMKIDKAIDYLVDHAVIKESANATEEAEPEGELGE